MTSQDTMTKAAEERAAETKAAISATAELSKLDPRCQGWAMLVPAGQPLRMPGEIHGANDVGYPYLQREGTIQLCSGDYLLTGEALHHRKSRGWLYDLYTYHCCGIALWVPFDSEVKAQIRAAILTGQCHAPIEILRGAGNVAGMVRRILADRQGFVDPD